MVPNQAKQSPISGLSVYEQSQAAFYRNLPELLKQHGGQWVAYHGDDLLGFGNSQTKLFLQCLGRGFAEDQFTVLFADNAALADQQEIDLPGNP